MEFVSAAFIGLKPVLLSQLVFDDDFKFLMERWLAICDDMSVFSRSLATMRYFD